jgi:hypothetical protein
MSILVRVTKAILSAMKAKKTAVPLQDYKVEAAVLTHAIAARHKPKPNDIDATQCIMGRQPSNKSTRQEP